MKKAATVKKHAASAKTVDQYLATLPKDKRDALAKLRAAIKAAAPGATEGISDQVPVFKLDGKPLVGFGAATVHCTVFVMSTSDAMRARLAALTGYKLGGGSIQFPADTPPHLAREDPRESTDRDEQEGVAAGALRNWLLRPP